MEKKLSLSYEHEGFFMFADNQAKTIAQKELGRFFRNKDIEMASFKKIVELPFPLIISVNPDKFLLREFAKFHVPYQFDYFSGHHKTKEYAIEKPKRDNPLVFNLCGSEEDRESLILDYDDLFPHVEDFNGGSKNT